MRTEVEAPATVEKRRGNRKRKALIALALVVAVLFFAYELYSFFQKQSWFKGRLDVPAYSLIDEKAYLDSLIRNEPASLQDSFVADVENGVKDRFTKADAYFLTHRYFDNGGDVYEIYDYVNSHPDLAFLKEAENIYPGLFDQLEQRLLASSPSIPSLYVVFAYLEVLDKYGYADIAGVAGLSWRVSGR